VRDLVKKDIPTAFEVLTTLIDEAQIELSKVDDDENDVGDAQQLVPASI
jgi:hypothetical protein